MDEKKKTGREIEIDHIDLDILKTRTTEIPGLIPYPHHSGGVTITPEDKGKIKGRAMAAMKEQTNRELEQLINQMKPLIDQANKLKKRIHISEIIYEADIPFEPLIGHCYYVYRKEEGKAFMSMISPEEWGPKGPYKEFVGKVKLLHDHTWEIED